MTANRIVCPGSSSGKIDQISRGFSVQRVEWDTQVQQGKATALQTLDQISSRQAPQQASMAFKLEVLARLSGKTFQGIAPKVLPPTPPAVASGQSSYGCLDGIGFRVCQLWVSRRNAEGIHRKAHQDLASVQLAFKVVDGLDGVCECMLVARHRCASAQETC